MKCNTCIHEWTYSADWTSPYGEWACMKTGNDLYRTEPEDVGDCKDYEPKNKNNENNEIKVELNYYKILTGNY